MARTGVAILAAPDAGPRAGRYWANVIAAVMTVVIALAASPVTSLLAILPRGYVLALAGLAILSAFQDALEKAFGGRLRFGAVVAFSVATTPFAFVGITSAFWAILAGLGFPYWWNGMISERTGRKWAGRRVRPPGSS